MTPRPYQQAAFHEFARSHSRFWAILWERQAGKSTTFADFALFEMLKHPGSTVIYASASLLLAQEITLKTAVRANQTVQQFLESDASRLKSFADNAQSSIDRDNERWGERPREPREEGQRDITLAPIGGDLSRLGSGERNLSRFSGAKVAQQPSERERASQRRDEGELNKHIINPIARLLNQRYAGSRLKNTDPCQKHLEILQRNTDCQNRMLQPTVGDTSAFTPFLSQKSKKEFKTYDSLHNRELKKYTAEDFTDLFRQQRLEFRIYHSPTLYSRTKVIAPNIATARSWSGTVLLDEVAFIRNFRELVTALLPVISTDKNFKLILSTTPPEFDDTHYSFELLAPPTGLEFKPSAEGNWYTSESGVRVHRADAFDTALAGKQIFDLKSGEEISPTEAFNRAPNKDGHRIAHWLAWMHGGAAACDFAHLKTAQERGSGRHTTGPLCQNFHIHSDADLTPALNWLSDNLGRTADGKPAPAQKPEMTSAQIRAQYNRIMRTSEVHSPLDNPNMLDPEYRSLCADYPTPEVETGKRDASLPVLRDIRIGMGFDVATTTRGKSNPSVVSVMEEHGVEWLVRARFIWKTRDPEVASQRLTSILDVLERRGIHPRALVQDATNERYYAEQNRQRFKSRVPVILIVGSQAVENAALDKPTNWKEYLGNQLIARLDDNNLTLPPDDYTRVDYRLVMKDRGKFVCEPNDQGMHGDCFDADKLAGHALSDLRKNRTVVPPITEADRLAYERERVKVPG